ncbi:MAG: sulfotransferase [Flavobacteriales bacterium]|nr:sulfotransferase [Flavobacteriales bacterium]
MNLIKKLRRKLRPPGIYARVVDLSVSPFLDARERKFVKGLDVSEPARHAPVFIVGAPRSGSTMFYQILANELDVLYISNFVHVFSSWLNTAFGLENKWLRKKKRYPLTSSYGGTFSAGWGAPSECGVFWYKHMPQEKHFLTGEDLSLDAQMFFRRSVRIPMSTYGKPFLFKNMNAGQRIDYLKRVFPEAKFIFIKRDVLAMAQSILKARKDIYGSAHTWWSIKPKEFQELAEKEPFAQIIGQIFYIEKQILKDFSSLEEKDRMVLSYEALCADPNAMISKVSDFINEDVKDSKYDVDYGLEASSGRKCSEEDYARLQEIIHTYNWTTYDL